MGASLHKGRYSGHSGLKLSVYITSNNYKCSIQTRIDFDLSWMKIDMIKFCWKHFCCSQHVMFTMPTPPRFWNTWICQRKMVSSKCKSEPWRSLPTLLQTRDLNSNSIQVPVQTYYFRSWSDGCRIKNWIIKTFRLELLHFLLLSIKRLSLTETQWNISSKWSALKCD